MNAESEPNEPKPKVRKLIIPDIIAEGIEIMNTRYQDLDASSYAMKIGDARQVSFHAIQRVTPSLALPKTDIMSQAPAATRSI